MAAYLVVALSATFLFATTSSAAATNDSISACNVLYSAYPDITIWDPLGPNGGETSSNASVYNDAISKYWNAKSADNRAACAFFPYNAQDVSFAVKTLLKYPSVPFALKSGGHNPNLGFSSTNGGVLIAFRPNSAYAVPSADQSTIDVGAGAKWEDPYKALDPYNKAVVGGRLGDIGVTGFVLGGGLSYLSSQYGLACDNVVNFEVVLADGTITNANAHQNPDLFFALKGGGNQYAIVTKLTLKTYDMGDAGQVWGGLRYYPPQQHSAITSAVSNFAANNKDVKAAIIPTFNFGPPSLSGLSESIVFFFYDAASPPPGIFDEFDAINSTTSDTKARSYYSLTQEAENGAVYGLRFQIRTNTFPNLPIAQMSSFLDQHWLSLNQTASVTLSNLTNFFLLTFTTQPLTTLIADASQRAGGNAYGLNPNFGDRIWIEYDLAWLNSTCDTQCPPYLEQLADAQHDTFAANYGGTYPTNYRYGNLDWISFNPIFMNDAMYDQDVLQSFGWPIYQRLKWTHEKYDPTGFFSTRQGGWTFK